MSDDVLVDALGGLFAYDTGCVDSGIHDEILRERVKAELRAKPDLKWLSRWVREQMLSDEALAQGYSLEDVRSFLEWLSERMDYDV